MITNLCCTSMQSAITVSGSIKCGHRSSQNKPCMTENLYFKPLTLMCVGDQLKLQKSCQCLKCVV